MFTFEDPAGNACRPAPLLFFVDTQGPQIVDVDVNSQATPTSVRSQGRRTAAPTATGPRRWCNSWSSTSRICPTARPTSCSHAVFAATSIDPGHYRWSATPTASCRSQSSASPRRHAGQRVSRRRATVTIEFFAKPLPDDRYTLTISDDMTDAAGNGLDGESNAVEPQDEADVPQRRRRSAAATSSARFTVDSRPEIGVNHSGSVWVDTNGNFDVRPGQSGLHEPRHRLRPGRTRRTICSPATSRPPGASSWRTASTNWPPTAGSTAGFRWLIDTDNDGVPNPPDRHPRADGPSTACRSPATSTGIGSRATGIRTTSTATKSACSTAARGGSTRTTTSGWTRRWSRQHGRACRSSGDFDGDGNDDLATWQTTASRF